MVNEARPSSQSERPAKADSFWASALEHVPSKVAPVSEDKFNLDEMCRTEKIAAVAQGVTLSTVVGIRREGSSPVLRAVSCQFPSQRSKLSTLVSREREREREVYSFSQISKWEANTVGSLEAVS